MSCPSCVVRWGVVAFTVMPQTGSVCGAAPASANGIRAYFFLQPNQWVAGSKPFSDDETPLLTNYPAGEEIGARYALLKQKIRELQADGVAAFDLTGLYAKESRTVYVDACCHVNELGNELLAERIADTIVREESRRL